MKSAIVLLVILFATGSATLRAQLVVPSYERARSFIFCDDIPQGEELSVPFDFINTGTVDITIDSAIAAGDTSDFYANHLVGSGEKYLNPVMWKFINGRIIRGGDAFFNSFFFTPKTPGNKQLAITIYYHEGGVARTTQMSVSFNTGAAPSGLGFLASKVDTIYYPGTSYHTIAYDRIHVADTLRRIDTVRIGDTLRAAMIGDKRIDLTTCGATTINDIRIEKDTPEDIFLVDMHTPLPFVLPSGDSMVVDFIYVPKPAETEPRRATVTFITEGKPLVLELTILGRASTTGVEDERGRPMVDRSQLESLPNPFASATTLRLSAAHPAHARLSVIDAMGEEVAILLDERIEPGSRDIRFDAAGLPAGFYLARLDMGGEVILRRLLLTR